MTKFVRVIRSSTSAAMGQYFPARAAYLLLCALPLPVAAQTLGSMDLDDKLQYHVQRTYRPTSILSYAASAGYQQLRNTPNEWGQGGDAYGHRLASVAGYAAIHNGLALGLDSALHQDPRYFRSTGSGLWRRTGHALRMTILTRTDSGGETFSTWRVGSAYGSAYLANQWYPDRLNNTRQVFQRGSIRLGFDFVSNLAIEFWPDLKARLKRRKP